MMLLYQLLFPLVAAVVVVHLACTGRSRALREGLADMRERFGLAPISDGRPVWFHAASVGEVRAMEPIVRALPRGTRLVVTTSTVAGRERARTLPGVYAAWLAPLDFYPAVLSFLKRVNPRSLILVETELWPMTLSLARSRGVRVGVVNGRITQRAFSRYRLIRRWLAPLLASFERVAVQTPPDAERFAALGVAPSALSVAGNMKFDAPPPGKEALDEARAWTSALGWRDSPVWVAGSTRPGEEEILLEAHARASRAIPGLKLILAPRHPERSGEVAGILRERGLDFVRLSDPPAPASCLLVDRLGALGALYGTARAAFVGGTLVPVGGHDLLEPARLCVPVMFGPHTESTLETAAALQDCGGGFLVRDAEHLAQTLLRLANGSPAGEAARRAAQSFAGATARTLEHIRPLLR